MAARRSAGPAGRTSGETAAVAAFFAVLAGVLVWRAGFGISYYDDAYYAAATLNLAGGARPLADEMFLQSLGFLPVVPLVKLWTAVFGPTGVVYAMRASYVLFAGVAGWLVYRALRPSFPAAACVLAAAAPLLAPPYSIVSPSYNTFGLMGMTTAVALAFAALRDDSRASAAGSGVAMAVATVAYPPFVAGSLALLLVVLTVGRNRRVAVAMLAGALVTGVLAGAGLLAVASIDDVRRTLVYALDVQRSLGVTFAEKAGRIRDGLLVALSRRKGVAIWLWYAPALAASVAAALPAVGARVRGALALSVPALIALPVAARLASGGDPLFAGTLGGNYLTALSLFLLAPVCARLARERRPEEVRLLTLAVAPGLIGFVAVLCVSNAGIFWASAFCGLAPLAAALLLVWSAEVGESLGTRAAAAGSLAVLALVAALLFSATFKDGRIRDLTARFPSGPLAGIATTPGRLAGIQGLAALAERHSDARSRVLFLSIPVGYLLTDGAPLTNAVWLAPGPSDAHAVQYFERRGWPDVAFVPATLVRRASVLQTGGRDPLIDGLERDYRRAEEAAGVVVFVKR